MKIIGFILVLSLLGLTKGDAFLDQMSMFQKIHLNDDYQIISHHFTPDNSVYSFLNVHTGTYEYTLMNGGKSCDLTVVMTVEFHGFLMSLPHAYYKALEDTCGLTV